jgi:general secretion pathway protein L
VLTLSGAASAVIDDLSDLAAPLAARLSRSTRHVAVAQGDDLALYQATSSGELKPVEIGRKRRLGGALELRLPADLVLNHRLALPAAGRDYLDAIIDHRLDRLTPWTADRVLYGYHVAGETPGGELDVEFAATSRAIADTWMARADSLGLKPTALGSAAEPLERPLQVDLWRGARDPVRGRTRRLVKTAAAVLALTLLPLCAASFWFAHQADQRLAAVEARTDAARRALQAAIGGGGEGSQDARLIEEKRTRPPMVVLIDRLASIVPTDTVLRDMEVDAERLRLAGVSAAAAGLIGKIEESGVARDTRFAAPVVRGVDGRDGFEIVATRAPAQGLASEAAIR